MFIVQGEGRGHMTQAISLEQLLSKLGHEVCCIAIGKSKRREIPEFVYRNLKIPIFTFESPNFITDKKGKGILLSKTITYNISKSKYFAKSLKLLDELNINFEPDVIINFYDILGGLFNFIYRPKALFWVIGHQYLTEHPNFIFAKHSPLQKLLFKLNTKITALGSEKQLALSFRPMHESHKQNLIVLPPLLRSELKNFIVSTGDFYLTYMVNSGYADDIIHFAKYHPTFKIEAFWDKKGAPSTFNPLPNVTFHHLNDRLFLEKMAGCKGLVSTAGFESICEAMYLGKPVLVMPVKGQYEQACNALDAVKSGAGITANQFDFLKFEAYINTKFQESNNSKIWTDSFETRFLKLLESIVKTTVPANYTYINKMLTS